MRLRLLYEAARLSMRLHRIHPAVAELGPGLVVDRIAYLDGRGLCPPEALSEVPLAVFLHGLGSSVATWSPVLPRIARQVPLVAPDLPGYGSTLLPEHMSHATLSNKVDTVIGFLEAVSPDRPVQLIGQSMGGWIAARVAAQVPERVSRLTLVNCAGILEPQVFRQRQLFSPADKQELRRLWRAMWHKLPVTYWAFEKEYLAMTKQAQVRGFMDTLEEVDFLNDHLPDITAKTLLVWGLSDRLIDYRSVRFFREGLRDVRVRPIPDCGHVPQRECPAAFLRYLMPWLLGQEPPEPARPGLEQDLAEGLQPGGPDELPSTLAEAREEARRIARDEGIEGPRPAAEGRKTGS